VEAKWHFSDLPVAVQVQLVVGGPLLFGAICGFLLGETATGWWVSQAVAAIGGFAAGLDHPDARSAALRGLTGGTLFGWGIVAADAISDNAHTAEAVHPIGLIVILTALTGCLLAALGGWVRARADA
jgi:hypothetical protein